MMQLLQNYKDSIKTKLIVNIILIHAVLMTLIVFDMMQREKSFIQEQLFKNGYNLSTILASQASTPLLNNDLVALNELIKDMNALHSHYMIFITDKNKRVRASNPNKYFNEELDDSISQTMIENIKDEKYYQLYHDDLIDTIVPIIVNKKIIGYIRTLIDATELSNKLNQMITEGLVYIAISILLGAFFAYLSIKQMTSKLNILTDISTEISNGNFKVKIPEFKGNDEVSKMSNAFSTMMSSINLHLNERRKKERIMGWQASHDGLTNLNNRASFEEKLAQMVDWAQNMKVKHSLLFLDLDDFKIVNDTSGHLAGDELLKVVSMIFTQNIRKNDFLARFGGDEFGIILSDCEITYALNIANKIIKDIKDLDFNWHENLFKIGVSIGVTDIDGLSDATTVLDKADQACYDAKKSGKGTVKVA